MCDVWSRAIWRIDSFAILSSLSKSDLIDYTTTIPNGWCQFSTQYHSLEHSIHNHQLFPQFLTTLLTFFSYKTDHKIKLF